MVGLQTLKNMAQVSKFKHLIQTFNSAIQTFSSAIIPTFSLEIQTSKIQTGSHSNF